MHNLGGEHARERGRTTSNGKMRQGAAAPGRTRRTQWHGSEELVGPKASGQ
ncbi:hypothetical protein Syun_004129 [Stephania yunnanensis]|uniref:Uncharacterized protein n=1 Tax=Stephania yunnanensis TaxID=152371 RepID=A0AAP0L2F9_9MAGN